MQTSDESHEIGQFDLINRSGKSKWKQMQFETYFYLKVENSYIVVILIESL